MAKIQTFKNRYKIWKIWRINSRNSSFHQWLVLFKLKPSPTFDTFEAWYYIREGFKMWKKCGRKRREKIMTNTQKYEEIFGFPPDKEMCPAAECKICPVNSCEPTNHSSVEWWDSEYKEPEDKKNG